MGGGDLRYLSHTSLWWCCGQRAVAWKLFRVGFLERSTAAGSTILLTAFRQELSKLGWIEGKNITIEYRFSENKGVELLPELAANLARLKVDLIVATDTPSALTAKNATSGTPIVMVNVGHPVVAGLVASLARPGTSVIGNAGLSPPAKETQGGDSLSSSELDFCGHREAAQEQTSN